MVEAQTELSSGGMADICVLPRLMSADEANEFFHIVNLDEGENQWESKLEQGFTRPADALADPGPSGKVLG